MDQSGQLWRRTGRATVSAQQEYHECCWVQDNGGARLAWAR